MEIVYVALKAAMMTKDNLIVSPEGRSLLLIHPFIPWFESRQGKIFENKIAAPCAERRGGRRTCCAVHAHFIRISLSDRRKCKLVDVFE